MGIEGLLTKLIDKILESIMFLSVWLFTFFFVHHSLIIVDWLVSRKRSHRWTSSTIHTDQNIFLWSLGFALHKVYCFLREGCKKIHMKSLVLCQTGGEGGGMTTNHFFFKCNELVRVHRWYQILAYFGQMLTDKTEARVANKKIFRWDQV